MPEPSSFLHDLTASIAESRPVRGLDWLMLTNGDSDPFDSVILFGFQGRDSDPSFVAKVPRLPHNDHFLEVEYRRLSELWSLVGPATRRQLPEPVAFVNLDGQPALVLSYVKGPGLVKTSGRGFWREQERVQALVVDAARSLRRLNEAASVPLAGEQDLLFDFAPRLARFSELFTLSDKEQAALKDLAGTVDSARRAATRKVLIQGDFWHGNLIRSDDTGELVFVDWQFAHWSVDVSVDVYLFLMAAALTAAPYGMGPDRARGAADVLLEWRSEVIPLYLQAYGQPEDYILLPPRHGMLATCVEKAVRPAMDFGYSHPDDYMWRLLFRELVEWPEENWHGF